MKKPMLYIHCLIIVVLISLVEGNGRYSYADCTYVTGNSDSQYFGSRCFCYRPGGIKWKDIWSTFQVSVTSSEDVFIVYPMETRNCHNPFKNLLTLATCTIEPYWPSSVHKEKTLDIPLAEEDVFFMTKSPRASAEYTLHVARQRFNWMRFVLFVSGLMLFFFAGAVCRSSLFFYISGVLLGMVSILVFLLLVLRSFVPKRGLFLVLFGAGSGLSYLGIRKVMNEGDEIMRVYWREVLGYLLASGLISFVCCYKLGPITNRRTLNLMTWGLQAVAMVVACHGITYAPLSWMLLVFLLCFKIVPLVLAILLGIWSQICWVVRFFWRGRQPKPRLLTEEEYREQGERHTKASLEELRKYCNSPGFPAWDTVLRLRSPQRFAEFLRGGVHVTSTEQQSHELHSHDQHFGREEDYDEAEVLNSAKSSPISEDFGKNALHSYSHAPPTPSIFCSLPALPSPPPCGGNICPYPPTPINPVPQLPYIEDDDEPF
ncbi:hypothetical protein NFI96_011727 [Prochilodus magdalenae]|nr:hypothetical protein NFI96_011727 [Prochilodus magdalenae]